MVSVWEHVNWLHAYYLVLHVKQAQVARLGGRIAAHVHDTLGLGKENGVNYVVMHTGSWGIGDDNVGTTIFIDKLLVKDIFHIAGEE